MSGTNNLATVFEGKKLCMYIYMYIIHKVGKILVELLLGRIYHEAFHPLRSHCTTFHKKSGEICNVFYRST
jgi:hypothetical protein